MNVFQKVVMDTLRYKQKYPEDIFLYNSYFADIFWETKALTFEVFVDK